MTAPARTTLAVASLSLVSPVAAAFAVAAFIVGAPALAQPVGRVAATTVAVLSPTGSRLATELRQELELAAFTVLALPLPAAAAGDFAETARETLSPRHPLAVVVRADGHQLAVLSGSAGTGPLRSRFDLHLASDDHPTRRRACLTVVEYLRVLGQQDEAAAPVASGQPVPAEATLTSTVGPVSRPFDDPPSRLAPQTMGVATTLDIFSAGSRPSGHLHFLWYFPVTRRLSLHTRARWPVAGVAFQSGGADVRMWTFGAAVGLLYAFNEAPARWRPSVGMAVGNRMVLTESSSITPLQTRSAVTPSATVSLLASLTRQLGRRAQLFAELEAARGWLVASANRTDYEQAVANALSLHASVGVLFEY